MHDIRFIREHPEAFDTGLKKRNLPPIAAELLEIDKRRRAAISESEAAQARRKALSRQIGMAKANVWTTAQTRLRAVRDGIQLREARGARTAARARAPATHPGRRT